MAAALRRNVALEKLHLRGNGVTDEGLCAIAQALDSNNHLSELLVWGNSFGPDANLLFARLFEGRFRYYDTVTDLAPYEVDGVVQMCQVEPPAKGGHDAATVSADPVDAVRKPKLLPRTPAAAEAARLAALPAPVAVAVMAAGAPPVLSSSASARA